MDFTTIQDHFQCLSDWAKAEGPFRMLEHIIVGMVIILFLKSFLQAGIKSRGNTSLIQNVKKMGVRLSRKLSFVNSKVEKELEA